MTLKLKKDTCIDYRLRPYYVVYIQFYVKIQFMNNKKRHMTFHLPNKSDSL